MKKYPKIVQADARGQIVIPKDIRHELGISEGTGFFMYSITDEGILLKKIPAEPLAEQKGLIQDIDSNAEKLGVRKKNITDSVKRYRKQSVGRLEEI